MRLTREMLQDSECDGEGGYIMPHGIAKVIFERMNETPSEREARQVKQQEADRLNDLRMRKEADAIIAMKDADRVFELLQMEWK